MTDKELDRLKLSVEKESEKIELSNIYLIKVCNSLIDKVRELEKHNSELHSANVDLQSELDLCTESLALQIVEKLRGGVEVTESPALQPFNSQKALAELTNQPDSNAKQIAIAAIAELEKGKE